jgi:hypothetical protein
MGLPERRQLSSVEASVLEEIDLFGGHQPLLLESTQEQKKPSRLSIIVQGFNDGEQSSIIFSLYWLTQKYQM